MSDFYRFGKEVRDLLRGVLEVGEAGNGGLAEFLRLGELSCPCTPTAADHLGYLSVPQRKIWVRSDSEKVVADLFEATRVSKKRWRVQTVAAGGALDAEYDVELVDKIDFGVIGKDPAVGDKDPIENFRCGKVNPATTSPCQNSRVTENWSWDASYFACARCEAAAGETCNRTFAKVGSLFIYYRNDCQGRPDITMDRNEWVC